MLKFAIIHYYHCTYVCVLAMFLLGTVVVRRDHWVLPFGAIILDNVQH